MRIDKLKLLSGDPIELYDVGKIYPFTIKDIKNMGGEHYFNKYLNTLLVNKEMIVKANENISEDDSNSLNDITDFEFIFMLTQSDKSFSSTFLQALNLVFKEDVTICDYGFCIGDINEGRFINNDNYDDLITIVKVQNRLEKPSDENSENPASDKAKELLEKRRLAREKLKIAKQSDEEDGEPLTLDDLVSILCANGNGINIFNVWDLSFYAFNDQFNRMKMLDDYDISIRSLLAGANSDDVELKHWMSKID